MWGQSDNGLVVWDPECVRSTKGDNPQRVGLRSFLEERIVSEYKCYTCAHKSRKISYLDLTIHFFGFALGALRAPRGFGQGFLMLGSQSPSD